MTVYGNLDVRSIQCKLVKLGNKWLGNMLWVSFDKVLISFTSTRDSVTCWYLRLWIVRIFYRHGLVSQWRFPWYFFHTVLFRRTTCLCIELFDNTNIMLMWNANKIVLIPCSSNVWFRKVTLLVHSGSQTILIQIYRKLQKRNKK